MFKQLQELQRQTKVQELNNGRQLNVMNQLSSMQNKQSSGPQFGMTNYGIPVRDPSQMFKFVDTKLGHRVSNQLAFSQTQNQGISGISSSQHFPFQWPSRDSLGSLTKSKSQLAGTYNKSLLGDQFNASSSEKAATLDPLEQKILFNTGDTSENWSALMQTAVADTSSSDDGTHKNDNALTPSFDNNSRSPYIGFRFGSSSQSQLVNHFDPSRITEHKMSTHNPLPNQNLSYSGSRHATFDSNVSQETPQIVAVKKEVDQRWSTTRSTNLRADVGFKNENVYYENKVPQVISLFQVNPAYGNRISQPSDQLAKKSTQAPVNPEKNGDMANKDVTVSKSKKRKFCNFECLPWHKEVTEGCSRLHDTSTTELEWAESAGRLPERLKEFEKLMVSRKRRLVMTTQLLQLLFRPAPAVILSEDATAHCDSVTYYAAKLALGDACSLCL
ncbi:uncharacterized protein [Rutidosis leptorrhynchoides]|uniref:uncharacterized protein n=1 Tax=Rutidosis leptorrhynchoides TaxID=125765 RepID=UPI003A99B9D5